MRACTHLILSLLLVDKTSISVCGLRHSRNYPLRRRNSLHRRSSTGVLDGGEIGLAAKEEEGSGRRRAGTTIFSQACLIAGTTIGGGFLALPTATAPLGAVPATCGLTLTWLYLLGASLSLRDTFFMLSEEMKDNELSLFRIVKECFGSVAALCVSGLFLMLVYATLVAQLSKIGSITQGLFGTSAFMGTIIFSMMLGTLSMLASPRSVEQLNNVMTGTMLMSFLSLVGIASRSDSWSFHGLKRANFTPLFPPAMRSTQVPALSGPWAIPVFIQLLLYSEVVPLVSSRLRDRNRTGKAIIFGSVIPLLMTLVWTCIALALIPYPPATAVATAVKGVIYDPLAKLSGRALIASVNTLAISAITTTALGSILATLQLLQDISSSRALPLINRLGRLGNKSDALTIDCDATVPSSLACETSDDDSSSYGAAGEGSGPRREQLERYQDR